MDNVRKRKQTSINVVCYKSKTLANGEHPLMLRICKDRKTKYVALGISCHADLWNFKKNEPKRSHPNKDLIEFIIGAEEKQAAHYTGNTDQ